MYRESGITGWLIRNQLVRDAKSANILQLFVIVIALTTSAILIFKPFSLQNQTAEGEIAPELLPYVNDEIRAQLQPR